MIYNLIHIFLFLEKLSKVLAIFTLNLQQQVEFLNSGIKTAAQLAEPLGKTATELVGNVINTLNQVLQNISAALAPKK